jgi:hypothetical protein
VRYPIPDIRTNLGFWGAQCINGQNKKENLAFAVYMVRNPPCTKTLVSIVI